MISKDEIKTWSLAKRRMSLTHAFRGVKIFFAVTPNAYIHLSAIFLVLISGLFFCISSFEWLALVLAIGLVFVAEALNTAVEIDINLTSPNYHPYARDTKDVAAGAVLLSALVAIIVGLIIFLPKVLNMLQS